MTFRPGAVLAVLVAATSSSGDSSSKPAKSDKSSEAWGNLRGLHTAEIAYFNELHTYSADLAELGFAPERGNRYAYYLDTAGWGPDGHFIAYALAKSGGKPADCWSISDLDRVVSGKTIPAGTPLHESP
ncbi:MAG TPA: hypothetical protein VH083_04605 [Myxococcales bacterium]|jgi:hypothetical protein|nr:hypothetical protein [Myxococcales bacterium]